ncbi:MAG: ABC transporter permease [Actinomycetota bacterium]
MSTSRSARTAIVVVMGIISVPLLFNALFAHNPPLGIYLNGVVIGCLQALLAMGLILVYRANRIINFAQASIGIVPAVVAVIMIRIHGWPYIGAFALVLVGSAILGALLYLGVIRLFERAPRLLLTISTIGLVQILAFLELIIPIFMIPTETTGPAGTPSLSGSTRLQGQISTPLSDLTKKIGGVFFSGDHLVAIVVVAGIGIGLMAFFRFTSIGIAIRASAENRDRATLVGIPIRRVALVVWMIAGTMSGIGVFLRAPLVGMSVGVGTVGPALILPALAAAVIARMESLGVAFLAALGIGAIGQASFYATRDATISNVFMLGVILTALLVQRRSFARAAEAASGAWQMMKEFRPTPAKLRGVREVRIARRLSWTLVAAFFVTLPLMVGQFKYPDASLLIIYAIVGVSMVVLTGWAGQVSLGQWAIAGVGAAAAGGLAANHGTDFFITIIVAGAAGGLFSAAVGIPALRIPGLFLAVTTLALADTMPFFFLNPRYFGWLVPDPQKEVGRPLLYERLDSGSDLVFYYICLGFLVVVLAGAWSLRRSRSGRIMIASRDNPTTSQAFGISLVRTRLAAFVISGFIAGVAGALYAYLNGAVDAPAFNPIASVDLFTMVVIGGMTSLAGPLYGAVYLVTFRRFIPDWNSIYLLGQGAGVFIVMRFAPGGLAEMGYKARDRFLLRVARKHNIEVPALGGSSSEVSPANGSGAPAFLSPFVLQGVQASGEGVAERTAE